MSAHNLKRKSITILGATGSIGSSVIDIIKQYPQSFELIAITANKNYKKLIKIAQQLKPKYICITDEKYYPLVKEALSDSKIEILSGTSAMKEICQIKVDICFSAIIGFAGFMPNLYILPHCDILAIANKETIVCGGKLFIAECHKHNTKIIPVDSEHNSIYQILNHSPEAPEDNKNHDNINKIYLTASGGPFLKTPIEDFNDITIEKALNHPNWQMGNKITIDSATMVNKGLEIIETYFLFNISKEKIDVVIHPESIIHALVSFNDGAVKAFLSVPDMKVSISFILGHPARIKQNNLLLDIKNLSRLNFEAADEKIKHRAIYLAKQTLQDEGIMPIVFNSANEFFVEAFLQGKIAFIDIVTNIEKILNQFKNMPIENFDHISNLDNEIRNISNNLI